MGLNLKYNEVRGQFINPAVQLNTSVTQIMNESIDLPQSDDMLFTSDLEDNYSPLSECEPYRIFKVDDPLTYRKFDPKAIKAAKDAQEVGESSSSNANAVNPVLNR